MPYIDWSDPEDMFGLLVEFVEDECSEAHEDRSRRRFLFKLASDLRALQERFVALSPGESIEALEQIQGDVAGDFEDDPVFEHLSACVDELKRIHGADAA